MIGVNGVLFADRADRLWRLGVYGFLRASQTANVAGERGGSACAHLLRPLLLIYFDPKSSRRMYALGSEILVVRRDVSGRAERHLWRAARN